MHKSQADADVQFKQFAVQGKHVLDDRKYESIHDVHVVTVKSGSQFKHGDWHETHTPELNECISVHLLHKLGSDEHIRQLAGMQGAQLLSAKTKP